METKVCVEFRCQVVEGSPYTYEIHKEFDPRNIPQKVDCPPNCIEYATYCVICDNLTMYKNNFPMRTNRLNVHRFGFCDDDPVHLPRSVQVADMLKRTKLPKYSVNGDVQLIHYAAFDNLLHTDFDCADIRVVNSNRLQDIVVPRGATRFELFDRYVIPVNINGEQMYLFTEDKLNREHYYIGYINEKRANNISFFETIDGKPGVANEKDIVLDPGQIDPSGHIIIGPKNAGL